MWEILRKSYRVAVSYSLPKPQVQASQFQVHISYLLQKCKKGKPDEMDLPFWKNDITGSEPAFGIADKLQNTQVSNWGFYIEILILFKNLPICL